MKFMKKILICFIIPALLFSCESNGISDVSPYSAYQMAQIAAASQHGAPVLQLFIPDDDYFRQYLTDKYQFSGFEPLDGAIYCANGGMLAFEIAVFEFETGREAKKARDALLNYIKHRTGVFMGYAPKQAAILESSVAVVRGRYAALFICDEPLLANAEFMRCFDEEPPLLPEIEPYTAESRPIPEPAERQSELYEPEMILAVWNGAAALDGLSYKNRRIFDMCTEVIGELITDEMEDYDKELIIHNWITGWADYDNEANNNAPDAAPDPDNDNPYGLFFSRKAICSGYSSTFQLFMDLIGIECITVSGTSGDAHNEHAWNMVNIEGEWYHVDLTWNDPFGIEPTDEVRYKYFNVNSDFMRETLHHWDEGAYPAASAEKLLK